MSPRARRRGIVLVALIGVFISAYLYLYAIGYYGALACGPGGGCDVVQASSYSRFLGFPVAGWGLGWYVAVLLVAGLGAETELSGKRWVSAALLGLAAGGLAFSVYLTALELWVIRAICRWCVASAILTLLIFAMALPEVRGLRRARAG